MVMKHRKIRLTGKYAVGKYQYAAELFLMQGYKGKNFVLISVDMLIKTKIDRFFSRGRGCGWCGPRFLSGHKFFSKVTRL